jgi:hypothetical protein
VGRRTRRWRDRPCSWGVGTLHAQPVR